MAWCGRGEYAESLECEEMCDGGGAGARCRRCGETLELDDDYVEDLSGYLFHRDCLEKYLTEEDRRDTSNEGGEHE